MAEIERVKDEADPNRCQGNKSRKAGGEQCMNRAEEGSDYCIVHGGNRAKQAVAKEVDRNYKLTRFKVEVDQKVGSSGIKSLREEIGILRLMMQERLNRATDTDELLMQSAAIADLAQKIQSAVLACHKIEGQMGKLLDKQAVIHFASVVIGIISDVVTEDEAAIIADRMTEALANIGEE